jgi:hypothetical protein
MRAGAFDQMEKAGLLERLNEERQVMMRQRCCRCGGLAIGRTARPPHYFWPSHLKKGAMVSMGMGKIVVEFFSAAISTSVCK